MVKRSLSWPLLAGALTIAACSSPEGPHALPPAIGLASTSEGAGLAGSATGNGPTYKVAGGLGYEPGDLICFSSNHFQPGDKLHPYFLDFDVFAFDPLNDTVLALPGVNTYMPEVTPRTSGNGRFLVFSRAVPDGHSGYQWDVLRYDMQTRLIHTLPKINTSNDEVEPDISDDGCRIVYVRLQRRKLLEAYDILKAGSYEKLPDFRPELRLYDTVAGEDYIVPGANRNFADIAWPTLSSDGQRIAYSASTLPSRNGILAFLLGLPDLKGGPPKLGESNIYIYDLAHGTQITPPFINTLSDEFNPDLNFDGSHILFVTDRWGSDDIVEVNLDNGFLDNLSFLNTKGRDEQQPFYLGHSTERIIYQSEPHLLDLLKHYDRDDFLEADGDFDVESYLKTLFSLTDSSELRAYNRTSGAVDTLPIVNDRHGSFGFTMLRAPIPAGMGLSAGPSRPGSPYASPSPYASYYPAPYGSYYPSYPPSPYSSYVPSPYPSSYPSYDPSPYPYASPTPYAYPSP
jgi:hypothetical protein